MPDSDPLSDALIEVLATADAAMARVLLSPEMRTFVREYVALFVPWMAAQSAVMGDTKLRQQMTVSIDGMQEFLNSIQRAHRALGYQP